MRCWVPHLLSWSHLFTVTGFTQHTERKPPQELRRGQGTGEQEDRRTGGQEDRRTGGQEDRRTGGQEDRRTGGERTYHGLL